MSANLIQTLQIATSGLNVFSVQTQIAAHNIANISTNGFKPCQVQLADGPSGLAVKVDGIFRDGELLESGDMSQRPASGNALSETDIVTETVSLIKGERFFQANAKTVTTVDNMLGVLVNMRS